MRHKPHMLFLDDDHDGAKEAKGSPVAASDVSPRTKKKSVSKKSADGLPAHSFQASLGNLATPVVNTVQFANH